MNRRAPEGGGNGPSGSYSGTNRLLDPTVAPHVKINATVPRGAAASFERVWATAAATANSTSGGAQWHLLWGNLTAAVGSVTFDDR